MPASVSAPMRAVVLPTAGASLQLCQRPVPALCQPHQVRVRVKAASVNPVDLKLAQRGPYHQPECPAVLGLDGAGVVDAVGAGVRHLSPGDAVMFCQGGLGGGLGTYAEFTVVDERYLAPKPANLSFEQAAAVPLVLISAWEALYDRAQIAAGQRVLIQGGVGGVGHMAIQLAQRRGARVSTTVSSEAKANLAGRLGADHCIYYRRMTVTEGVAAWLGAPGNGQGNGPGVDVVCDLVGEPALSESFGLVRPYGQVVTLHGPTTATDWATARARNLQVSFVHTLTPQLTPLPQALAHQADILRRGSQWLDTGQLTVRVDRVFPLAEAAAAHQYLATASVAGKVVLSVG